MAINYTKIGWDTSKYVNPTNMNQMDNGIKAACDGVDAISANYMKASTTDGQTMVITSAQNTGFFLQSGTGRSNIGFKNSSGAVIGFLGVGSDSKPYFYDTTYREIALVENAPIEMPMYYASSSATLSNVIKAWLQEVCRKYPGKTYRNFVGAFSYNGAYRVSVMIYDTSSHDSDYTPQYGWGEVQVQNYLYLFSCNNYNITTKTVTTS